MSQTKISCHNSLVFALILVLFCFTPAFALTPEIDSIEPDHGATSSPTDVTIYGANFEATPKAALYGGGPYVGSVDTPGNAYDVFVLDNHAYVADSDSGLQVIDISDPANPAIVGSADTTGRALGVHVSGNYAYVAAGFSHLQVVDISDPANPTIVGSAHTPTSTNGVYVSGNYAYVAAFVTGDNGLSGLQVVEVSDPTNPTIVGSADTPGYAFGVYVSGNHAYVADYENGLQVVEVSDPANPAIVGSADTPHLAIGVYVSGDYAYVADAGKGLQVLRKFDPCTDITFFDSSTLTATVPAGLPLGTYNLHVTNPNGERAILYNSFTVSSYPDISCSTTSNDFGKVNVRNTSRHTFEVNNLGDADLEIGNLSITGADASQFKIENDNCTGQTCPPSVISTVDVVFSPGSEGTKSANLLIPSNDPDTPTLDVALSGEGTAESGDGGGGGAFCFIATAADD